MNIYLKSLSDIKKIRLSAKIACDILKYISQYIKPGISTDRLDFLCYKRIVDYHKAYPSSLGYNGFPKSVCISINDVVCHGIPNKKDILREGDILNIDVAILKNNYHADMSRMFFVGKPSKQARNLCKITQNSLNLALKIIKPGINLILIGKIIQKYIENYNFSVVKNFCGHGIGRKLHEEPYVLHYYSRKYIKKDFYNVILKAGMVFTVEPMVNVGSNKVKIMKDGWTVKTLDGSLSAQYEHTVYVTNYGCEVLTKA